MNDYKQPEMLSIEELAELLPQLADLKEWINKVESYALAQAKNGTPVPGYKLVEGRSIQKYVDQDAVVQRLKEKGYDVRTFYKPQELISVSEFKKRIGKTDFGNFADLVVKPMGKLTLVPESDKRQAVDSATLQSLNPFADDDIG